MEAAEFDVTLKDLETRLDRLKALYEMYFQGIERIEPSVPRKQVDRIFELLRREQPRSTHLRFRYQSLLQRYTTLQTYWRRITRQIEEGTYKRDIQRLKRKDAVRAARRGEADEGRDDKGAYELDLDVDTDLSDLLDDPELDAAIAGLTSGGPARPVAGSPAPPSAATPAGPRVATFGKPTERRRRSSDSTNVPSSPPPRPAPPPAPSAARPAAPPRPPSGDVDDVRMKRIYDDYVAARRRNNERVDNVKYETLQRSIQDMMPKLREKHVGKSIDFEVVVRDGRVGLKPVTK
ncbi:MAG: hypothetical protein H6726_28580 [Sandaracinaceae bacterium]|nr:hypothetical protein [Sandaracinaceae bacterium]